MRPKECLILVSAATAENEPIQLTLSDNIASDIITKSQVASDGNEQIDTARTTNTGQDDRRCLERTVVLNLVENREHLLK